MSDRASYGAGSFHVDKTDQASAGGGTAHAGSPNAAAFAREAGQKIQFSAARAAVEPQAFVGFVHERAGGAKVIIEQGDTGLDDALVFFHHVAAAAVSGLFEKLTIASQLRDRHVTKSGDLRQAGG